MRNRLAVLGLLLPILAACGGDPAPKRTSDTPSSPSPASEAPTTPPKDIDAEAIADAVEEAVSQVVDRVKITEDNDTNDLIGRPGQYDQAVFLADKRLGCTGPGYDELSIDCGAKIERWPDAKAARGRIDEIQKKLRDFGLGAEWDYLIGRSILRVSGTLKPSQAKAYEAVAESMK